MENNDEYRAIKVLLEALTQRTDDGFAQLDQRMSASRAAWATSRTGSGRSNSAST